MGWCRSKTAKLRRDSSTCGKAVEMAPDFPDGHNHLGLALAKMEQMDEASEQIQKAVALKPKSAEYSFNLGYVLDRAGISRVAAGRWKNPWS